jgi:magnesium-protoporphyrin O-methyltransferase
MSSVPADTYAQKRSQLAEYFDRTALDAWARLTSDEPVSGIRATVRAGREAMRARLLAWLPQDLTGRRVLDAGCGTGALAAELARRGARVVAVDLSPRLIALARERHVATGGRIEFVVGDMLDPALGVFDHVVAMDSLVHYRAPDIARALAHWAPRVGCSLAFTFAPRTPLLAALHAVGRMFPRGDRAPAIEPVRPQALAALLARTPALDGWRPGRDGCIAHGFYISQAQELVRR